jgi:DNA polymerase-3 subunit alpha
MLHKLNLEKELVGIYLSAHPLDPYKIELEHICRYKLADMADLAKLEGYEVTFGGLVTEVREAMTKTGKPFGVMTIEDYSGSFQISLFGNDYTDFRNYMIKGHSIFVKGKVQKRQWGKDPSNQLEFKVLQIRGLDDLRHNFIKTILLEIPISNLNDGLIDELDQQIAQFKGNTTLKFIISDPQKDCVSIFFRVPTGLTFRMNS